MEKAKAHTCNRVTVDSPTRIQDSLWKPYSHDHSIILDTREEIYFSLWGRRIYVMRGQETMDHWMQNISEFSPGRWPKGSELKDAFDINFTNEEAKFHKAVPWQTWI